MIQRCNKITYGPHQLNIELLLFFLYVVFVKLFHFFFTILFFFKLILLVFVWFVYSKYIAFFPFALLCFVVVFCCCFLHCLAYTIIENGFNCPFHSKKQTKKTNIELTFFFSESSDVELSRENMVMLHAQVMVQLNVKS